MSLLELYLDPTPILLLAVSSLLIWWSLTESKVRTFLKRIPGPRLYPIIGNALTFRNPEEFLNVIETFPEKYGNRVKMILGNHNVLLLTHPDDVEKVLSSPAAIPKAKFYNFSNAWLGNDGLFVAKGDRWRQLRKLYNPLLFHYKVLEGFQKVFNDQSRVTVDIIKEKVGGGEGVIKMHELFMKLTLDIILEVATGKNLNTQRDPEHFYAEAVAKASEYLFQRIMTPWLHPDILFKYSPLGRKDAKNLELMRGFIAELINERKLIKKESSLIMTQDEFEYTSVSNSNFCGLDFFLQMQEDGVKGFSDAEIRDEANSLMFAGHDTTASNLIMTLFILGNNIDAQQKIQEELDSVFGEDKERPVTSADLGNLKYLECCLKESLRIYPAGPIIARRLEQDIVLDEKCVLPKGLDVMISPWVTNRLPEFHPDPLEFRPERFLPENCMGRHPYANISFSGGLRNCQGIKFALAEDKIILANIFRNFDVRAVDDPANMVLLPELVIRPKGDIKFKFTLRE